jgi:hypothetical protein
VVQIKIETVVIYENALKIFKILYSGFEGFKWHPKQWTPFS